MGFCRFSRCRYRSIILTFIDWFYHRHRDIYVDRHQDIYVDRHRHLHHRNLLIYISFVNFVYRPMNGERRRDLTPAARLQSVTNTLGRESARMNLSHSLTTSRTHTKPRRARHAETVWSRKRGTNMQHILQWMAEGLPLDQHGSSTQTWSDRWASNRTSRTCLRSWVWGT